MCCSCGFDFRSSFFFSFFFAHLRSSDEFCDLQVLDATDNEPWGPHGTVLAEIAQATKKLLVSHEPFFFYFE